MMKNEIEKTLGSTIGHAVGAKPTEPMTARQEEDLQNLGFLGKKGGLTLKGSIYVERLKNRIPF